MFKLTNLPTGQSVFIDPVIAFQSGDPKAGIETGNRTPPGYGVERRSVQLPPTNIGASVLFRNELSQATSQAMAAWISSAANPYRPQEG